jgi:two-component system OmpR family sensor kinase
VEVDRLQRLTEDLLLLAQSADGELPLHREDVDLSDLFADVGARFAPAFAQSGRPWELGTVSGTVHADRGRLTQALTNLVGNALEHGGGAVRLEARRHDDLVDLVVVDEGDGFAPEMLERGTERFARSPRSTGAGLGLAIVAAVADAHGGSTGLRTVDRGAEAWISVPAADVSRAAPPAEQLRSAGPAPHVG